MTRAQLPVLVPLAYLFFAFVAPPLGLWRARLAHPVALAGSGTALALALAGLAAVLEGGTLRYRLGGWAPPEGIEFVLDPLSAFVAALVAFAGFLAVVASGPLIEAEVPRKRVLMVPMMLLLLAGLSGMVITGDLFNLYVFLEIASISAYALIATGDDRKAPMAAFRYLILGSVGGSFYLIGVGFLYFSTGSLNMQDVARLLPALGDSRAVMVGATFMLVGLGLKMALFPLHTWLPDAYTHSPYAVSSLIAPVMTKVSAYAVIRLLLDVFGPDYLRDTLPMVPAIGWLSAAGVLVASLLAIAQHDYRRMLAYSSVSQLAFIGLGIGLGSALGLLGALLHILNHALMKACLFLVGGAIRLRAGTVEVPRFGGLGRRMPWTMACFTVAALSMVGVPPTAGFFSKWYLALASVEAGQWVFLAVIVASGLLTAVYLFRVLENVYDRKAAQDAPGPEEPAPSLFVPIVVLAAGILIAGLGNVVIIREVLAQVTLPLEGK
jgi:multicomponent Na+:H+ antiporter subunit D